MEMVDRKLTALQAEADIRGSRIDLSWSWSSSSSNDRPGMRLLRRRSSYSKNTEEGHLVFSLAEIFQTPDQYWHRFETDRFVVTNSIAEGGLLQARFTRYYGDNATEPSRVSVDYYDTSMRQYQHVEIDNVTRIETSIELNTSWEKVITHQVYAEPNGQPESLIGEVTIFTNHEDGITPNRFEWLTDALTFDRHDHSMSVVNKIDPMLGLLNLEIKTEDAGKTINKVSLNERHDPDRGEWNRQLIVEDGGLEAETVYYYALFIADPSDSNIYRSEPEWRKAVMATGRYGLDEKLYELLPAIHRNYDEPEPENRGQGELRKYSQIFGSALDQTRSLAKGLQLSHDVQLVHADRLPQLAHWIGWEPDLTLGVPTQRNDIRYAPETYSTVGTLPNLCAMINRLTGYECKIKEFVHNVFLTNAPEKIRPWELWQRTFTGTEWLETAELTQTEGFDGHPALATDANGTMWAFWHADRNSRRSIWLKPLDSTDSESREAVLYRGDDDPNQQPPISEYPSVVAQGEKLWLFWDSNRSGHWDIWGRWDGQSAPFSTSPPINFPKNLSDEHPADDRHPAAVVDQSNRLWVFWQSNRRGPTDIWSRVYDESNSDPWGLPKRVTTAQFRHEQPAAVVDDNNRIWLFYTNDNGGHRNLAVRVHSNNDWIKHDFIITEGKYRNEAPTAVWWQDQVWLFWQTNSGGRWHILGQPWIWELDKPKAITEPIIVSHHTAGDKEPAAMVDTNGELRVVWRSQHRGMDYQSHTVDTTQTDSLGKIGQFADRLHYTYDAARTNDDWYARDTIGLYVTLNTEDKDLIDRNRRLLEGPIKKFLPINVRAVLSELPAILSSESYRGLADSFTDTLSN